MAKTLRALVVEDSEDDCRLLIRELQRGGYDVSHERVQTLPALKEALGRQPWDVVIADYVVPQLNGLEVLRLARERDPGLPFILVSGAIGEELAVAAMKAGAHDYIMKGNLARLVPAVERELREAEGRRRQQQAEDDLRQEHERLQVQLRFANALNRMAEAVIANDDSPTVLGRLARILGETLALDRVAIFNVQAEQREVARLGEWHGALPGPGAPSFDPDLLLYPAPRLLESRTWLESHADAVHPCFQESAVAQRLHQDGHVRSLLAYPFLFRGSAFCLLVFVQTGARRKWGEDELKFLDLVANQVGLALQKIHILTERRQAEEALRESQIRLRKVTNFWNFGGGREGPDP